MLLLLSLWGCKVEDTWSAPEHPPIVEGAPQVGAAEGFLELPIGTPLGGYTPRCGCLGGISKQDDRTSAYATAFGPSTGVHTYPSIKVIWIENGDDHLVVTKTDQIYSYDGLVKAVEAELAEAIGEDLTGRVVHTTNHSHASFATHSDQIEFYLGGDKFNRENFDREVDQIVQVALQAYERRVPARIGLGWAKDWDPYDQVYRDRRGENDALVVWEDQETPGYGKDPFLGVMRFDTLDDEPIALIANFGMHGIIADAESSIVSSDAGGGLEAGLEETFDEPVVVMFAQGAGGDASPAGRLEDYAAIETIGELGAPLIRAVYDQVPTSADPIHMETVSRAIPKHPSQIQVTRDGAVDWSYAPYDAEYEPDDVVYNEDGTLASPFDEFNVKYGAVFCGTGDLDFPVGKIDTQAYPYSNCMDVELISRLLLVFFEIAEEDLHLPLPESLKAYTTASRIGPLTTMYADGTVAAEDLLVGFFPGEATAMYTEQWRRRVEAELGYHHPMMISYAQDHEGYLLVPEDWLMGGYEPDIGVWGPLEGEHVMEGVLATADELLSTSDVREDPDPLGYYGITEYPDKPLPTLQPDLTPTAGTRIETPPEYLWTPMDMAVDLAIPAQVPRVQGLVQLAWEGGDPGIDNPEVTIERLEGGEWVPLTTHAGRLITEAHHDILLAHTPDPIRPEDFNGNGVLDAEEEQQTHQWWAVWQTVGHVRDRAGLPLGTYRVHVRGQRYVGGDETWPWTGEPYEVIGPELELVPAAITVTPSYDGVYASILAPSDGYRLVHLDGSHLGDNPLVGPVTVDVVYGAGGGETLTIEPERVPYDARSWLPLDLTDVIEVTVTDAYGNVGAIAL